MNRPFKALNPTYFKRYRDFARLLVKHGEPDLAERIGLTNYLSDEDDPDTTQARAEDLAADLEEMGPTFVKLGQLLSTRADMLPIDMLRCKLAFFGASKFDPKSDRWTRITLCQGAPLFDELDNADDWWLPVASI